MSVTQIIQLVLGIVAAAFGLLHKALPRKLGFILMSIAAALAVIVGIAGVAVSHDSPFLIPFGISLVVGAIIALLATGTILAFDRRRYSRRNLRTPARLGNADNHGSSSGWHDCQRDTPRNRSPHLGQAYVCSSSLITL